MRSRRRSSTSTIVRCVRDLRATLAAARAGQFGFAPGKLVPLGLLPRRPLRASTSARSTTSARRLVNFYGRLRFARQPIKPFLPTELTGLVEVPYLGHFAEFDALIPLGDVEELTHGARRARRAAPHRRLPKARATASSTRSGPPSIDPDAAARAWARTIEFLKGLRAA